MCVCVCVCVCVCMCVCVYVCVCMCVYVCDILFFVHFMGPLMLMKSRVKTHP